MSDQFTEITNQSWFSRIGDAIKGIIFGLILFVVAFPLLVWNEGNSVKTYKSLKEGSGAVIPVSAETVNPANAGKLVHITGEAVTEDTLVDPEFNITTDGLKLIRDVQIYQWKESSQTNKKKNVGGSTTTETTYSYDKAWVGAPISSSSFKKPEGHTNTGSLPVSDNTIVAQPITVGAFTLNGSLVGSIDNKVPYSTDSSLTLPEALGTNAKVSGGGVYFGDNPSSPQIGDVRVRFSVVPPGPVSVVAQQVNDTFEAYTAKAGGTIQDLMIGTHSAQAMFDKLQAENKMLTWGLRVAGFLMMGIGLSLVFRPLSVLADVLPILGSIVGAGTGLIAFLIAFGCSFITIAIAWIVYRPLLGGILLIAGVGAFVMIGGKLKKAKAQAPVQTV